MPAPTDDPASILLGVRDRVLCPATYLAGSGFRRDHTCFLIDDLVNRCAYDATPLDAGADGDIASECQRMLLVVRTFG